ncbi:pyrophosphorylase [Propionibacterium australiense]|uniref:Pyrophosphorylase n=2 Tax=Propionibacterium australiense TaxID=119981 RepID=A0A8B3FPC7_9ACTN|nr:pyrophosphorylase [Propionibacterium australiense]
MNSINQIRSTTNGGLSNELTELKTCGETLCDKNNWDGPLADKFRSDTWPATRTALDQMVEKLNELQQQTSQIQQAIMSAGGSTA